MALRDDPTPFGVILFVIVSGVGFLFVGPISVVPGAAAFFLPHVLGRRR